MAEGDAPESDSPVPAQPPEGTSRGPATGQQAAADTGPLGMQGVKFTREPDYVATYHVFISSAGEMQTIRERVDRLLHESINPALRDSARTQLLAQMWERAQAQQQHPDRNVNEIFVERALRSHAVMALFRRQLRPGTQEEVEALVDAGETNPETAPTCPFCGSRATRDRIAKPSWMSSSSGWGSGKSCGRTRERSMRTRHGTPWSRCWSPTPSPLTRTLIRGSDRMSSKDSRRSLLDEEKPIQLALLWDVPRLRATGDPDAEAFIASFGPLSEEPLELPEHPAPLLAAAAGIRADRAGDADTALSLYDRIAGTFWRDLLRWCIRAWSATVIGTDDIAAAAERIERLPRRSDTRALLSVKLATFAYDKGDRELFARLLRNAVAATRPNTRLRSILTLESINFLGERPSAPGTLRGLSQSRLADRDWIDAWALEGAQEFLSESVADHARDPWSGVIRVGQRPLDRIVAAEAQATWAGALWQRRGLRRQLGAQLLLGDPSQPGEAAQGLWQWFSSGGRDHTAVVSLVEPVLDRAACDWLIQALASRVHPPETVINTLARVTMSLWDCVSEELIPRILSFLPAQAGDHPLFADNRRVWALMSIRSPRAFAEGFVQLDAVDQVAFAGDLSESALRRAVPSVRQRLLGLLAEVATQRSLGEDEWRARILLERAEAGEVQLPSLDLAGASPVAIVDAAQLDRQRVDDADLERAVEQLTESVRRERAQAHEGTYGIGGRSASQLLAAGINALGQQPSAAEGLWETALDEGLVGDLRLQALTALASLAAEGQLTPDRRDELRSSVVGGDRFGSLPVSGDLLRAARLLVLAGEMEEVEEVELMVLGRSRDVRARELAVNAGGLALARARSERLDQLVLTALFDPNEGVIRRGLAVLRERDLSLPAADEVVGRRLVELMETRRRATRAAAAQVAVALRDRGQDWAVLRRVLQLAAEDKSWQVNQAASATSDGD